jgi:hypothetical protein
MYIRAEYGMLLGDGDGLFETILEFQDYQTNRRAIQFLYRE